MTGLQISITNVIGQSNKVDLNIYLISEQDSFLVSEADASRMIIE